MLKDVFRILDSVSRASEAGYDSVLQGGVQVALVTIVVSGGVKISLAIAMWIISLLIW